MDVFWSDGSNFQITDCQDLDEIDKQIDAIETIDDCKVLKIFKRDFNALLSRFSEDDIDEKLRFLGSVDLFHDWSRNQLIRLWLCLKKRSFIYKQVLYTENDAADGVYFVVKGEF
jgi:hypothetical protein